MLKQTKAIATAIGFFAVQTASAQSSVTLYGVVDNAIVYQNSQTSVGSTEGGHSAFKMSAAGIWAGPRIGLRGVEEIGGSTAVVFQIEQGYSSSTGSAVVSGLAFSRQAFVGLKNASWGALTFGRQYTPYYKLLSPWSPTTWLTGAFGAHPGDLDSMDTSFRVNNSVSYTSNSIHGFTVSGMYALGGVPGRASAGATWSMAAQYRLGPFGVATAFQRIGNSTEGGGLWGDASTTSNNGAQPAVSAITTGYRTAQSQQRLGVTGGWSFTPSCDISFSYSNVQYIPASGSAFKDPAIFNTVGTAFHVKAEAAWDLAAGYSYTWSTRANGIASPAQYHQFSLAEYYAVSKRTGLYAVEGLQVSRGDTLSGTSPQLITKATPSIGDGFNGTPASGRSMIAVAIGLIHRF